MMIITVTIILLTILLLTRRMIRTKINFPDINNTAKKNNYNNGINDTGNKNNNNDSMINND